MNPLSDVSLTNAPYQTGFQRRWPHITHPDVRNLVWLLDAPGLLNAHHPRWVNQVAELPPVISAGTTAWLSELDRNPAPLIKFLSIHPHTRLGHYAENLLAFYFKWRGELVAHGVQVRSHTTLGEFDFLLNTASGFEHWEFACKFYLFVQPANSLGNYIGPDLRDNLDDKAHKIMDLQLALGKHADAQKYLPQPLSAARALLKGWLFYPLMPTMTVPEVAPWHCRGTWCRLAEFDAIPGHFFRPLTRLKWLAPAKLSESDIISRHQLKTELAHQFMVDSRPVLVSQCDELDGYFVESGRVFVVPDPWNSTPAIR